MVTGTEWETGIPVFSESERQFRILYFYTLQSTIFIENAYLNR